MRLLVIQFLTISAVLTCSDLAYCSAAGPVDPALVAQVQHECSKSVDAYSNVCRSLEEEAVLTTESGRPPVRGQVIRVTTHTLEPNVLIKTVRPDAGAEGRFKTQTQVRNANYSFTLSQSTPDAPYVMLDYKVNSANDGVIEGGLAAAAYQDLRHLIDATKGTAGHRLVELRMETQTKLHAVLETAIDRGQSRTTQQRELWIDTTSLWRITSRIIHTPTQNTQTTIYYGSTIDDILLPERIVEETTRVKGLPSRIDTTLSLKKTTKAGADFMLSAFDLPEPVDQPPPKSRNYVWLLSAAAAFGLLAFGLWFFARRRARAEGGVSS